MDATGLLLDLAEHLLNAFAAAISLTDPSDATALQRLVSQYGAARQDTLQDALNGSVAVCTRGMTHLYPEWARACLRKPDKPRI